MASLGTGAGEMKKLHSIARLVVDVAGHTINTTGASIVAVLLGLVPGSHTKTLDNQVNAVPFIHPVTDTLADAKGAPTAPRPLSQETPDPGEASSAYKPTGSTALVGNAVAERVPRPGILEASHTHRADRDSATRGCYKVQGLITAVQDGFFFLFNFATGKLKF